MKRTLLFVLTLSGLSALSTNIFREYHYVHQLKTWDEAQSYCREKFNDLATVDNPNDSDRLLSVSQGHGKYAWIGLNDVKDGWKWAVENVNLEFSNWRNDDPNIKKSNEACGVILHSGYWRDSVCLKPRPAVCYHAARSKYILVQNEMTWHEARTHCRSQYTDLAIVRNVSENQYISSLVSLYTWIGLHKETWPHWSDQTPKTFTNWYMDQPANVVGRLCTMINTTTGTWFGADCGTKHYFLCQTVYYPSHRKMFKLKFQSEADLNDPVLRQQILEQLHDKLEKHGLPDYKLRWIQTDGQTFHKEQTKKKEGGSSG